MGVPFFAIKSVNMYVLRFATPKLALGTDMTAI